MSVGGKNCVGQMFCIVYKFSEVIEIKTWTEPSSKKIAF